MLFLMCSVCRYMWFFTDAEFDLGCDAISLNKCTKCNAISTSISQPVICPILSPKIEKIQQYPAPIKKGKA